MKLLERMLDWLVVRAYEVERDLIWREMWVVGDMSQKQSY